MRAQAGLTFLTVATMLFALVTPATHGEDREITIVPETETVKRIRAVLDSPVSEEFKPEERKGPLHKIIKRISELHQIPIEFDNKEMSDAGVQSDIPVVFSSAKIPLKSSLRMMLRPNELTTVVRDERLMVTTKASADDVAKNGIVRIYDVGDLCPMVTRQNRFQDNKPEFSGDALVQLIQGSIGPICWSPCGGQGAIRISLLDKSPILVVSNTEDIQDEVANLLGYLRASRACQEKPDPRYEQEVGGVPVSFGKSLHYPWRKQLQALHDFKTIEKIELQELPKQFGGLFDLPIELDTRALGDAGVGLDCQLRVAGGRFSVEATLTACLRPYELTWLVRDDVFRLPPKPLLTTLYSTARFASIPSLISLATFGRRRIQINRSTTVR